MNNKSNENMKFYYIAAKMVDALELLAEDSKRLHCSVVGMVVCDYFADIDTPIYDLMMETTWNDFFEVIWEQNKGAHILYGDDMEPFVEEFAGFARNHVVALIPYITMELFHAGFEDYECRIIDQEDGILLIKAKVK